MPLGMSEPNLASPSFMEELTRRPLLINTHKYSLEGAKSEDDDFIEVHIFGPLTVLTMEQVVVMASPSRRATITKAIKSKLSKHKVQVN